MTKNLPQYSDLPVVDGAPPHSSWGLWGPEDRLGSLNLITPEKVAAASKEVRRGAIFPLNLELTLPNPPFGGRAAVSHTVIPLLGGIGNDDQYDGLNPQSSSQLDGFAHHQHPQYGFYNGLPRESHGIHHWAQKGIATRGVVIDLERWCADQGRPIIHGESRAIEAAELLAAIESQGTEIEPGDMLLIHTGFINWYRGISDELRRELAPLAPPGVGLARGAEMAATLWDLHPCIVASDNMAVEVWPPPRLEQLADTIPDSDDAIDAFLHNALLPLLGIPLGELWDLQALAEDCSRDGVYTCMVTSAPMNMEGGVASMGNAIAIK